MPLLKMKQRNWSGIIATRKPLQSHIGTQT
jgi:hypothetical protein